MDIIGIGSLPIVLLTGFFIGAVMVLQTASQFERFGETALTGDIVSLALVREFGPAITGLSSPAAMPPAWPPNSAPCWSPNKSTPCAPWAPIHPQARRPARACHHSRPSAAHRYGRFRRPDRRLRHRLFHLAHRRVEFWTRAINALEFSDLMQGMAKPLVFGFHPGHRRLLQGFDGSRRHPGRRPRHHSGRRRLLGPDPALRTSSSPRFLFSSPAWKVLIWRRRDQVIESRHKT